MGNVLRRWRFQSERLILQRNSFLSSDVVTGSHIFNGLYNENYILFLFELPLVGRANSSRMKACRLSQGGNQVSFVDVSE